MTPEQIELHRKRFEELFAAQGTGHTLKRNSFYQYQSGLVHFMWQGYLMAIESIEIYLPEQTKNEDHPADAGFNVAIRYCTQEIQSLGLKVKER